MGDFGLSVLVRGDGRTERAGTLEYMAPEVQRCVAYSTGADVWSFGCIALFGWATIHHQKCIKQCVANSRTIQTFALWRCWLVRACSQNRPTVLYFWAYSRGCKIQNGHRTADLWAYSRGCKIQNGHRTADPAEVNMCTR